VPELIVRIPAPLTGHAGGKSELTLEADTLAEALASLASLEPLLASRLLADDGSQRPYVNLFLDGRDIRSTSEEEMRIRPGSVLTIVPSIAGGRPGPGDDPTAEERFRYHRQTILPGFGEEGQALLRSSRVLLVGAGGLGSPAALYLAAAGVGRLGIIDSDTVDLSNLHRQILHDTTSVGKRKVDSAEATLTRLNPNIEIVPYDLRLDSGNALEIFAGWDVVVDGSDNFPTRYLVNDACVLLGIPCVYGAIFRYEGQASVFGSPAGPCYRCLFRDPPPAELVPGCDEAGVLGVLPGIVGTIQATETLKLLLGTGRSLAGRLLLIDAGTMEFRELEVRRDPECPLCGEEPAITALVDYEEFCGLGSATAVTNESDLTADDSSPAAGEASLLDLVVLDPAGVPEIGVEQLRNLLDRGAGLQLVDVRETHEWEISNLAFAGAKLVPLGQLFERLDELDPQVETVVYCRSGSRSAMAVKYLQSHDFVCAVNLRGGINDWAARIDPGMPRY
jgi:molybdopterin/thiamine biosynthesis adenylyltransferase/rhodanese-related sulfurtransferase/molybdopterin converting factor small subunit